MTNNYSFWTTPSHFENEIPNNGIDYSFRAWMLFGLTLLVAISNFKIIFVLLYLVCGNNLFQIKLS